MRDECERIVTGATRRRDATGARWWRLVMTGVLGSLTGCQGEPATGTQVEPGPQKVTQRWIAALTGYGSVAADERYVYAATLGGEVVVLSRETGTHVRAVAGAGFTTAGGLAAVDGALLVANLAALRRFHRETDATEWTNAVPRASATPLLVDDSLAFLPRSVGASLEVHAVRVRSGSAKWVVEVPLPPGVTFDGGPQMQFGGVALRGDRYALSYVVTKPATGTSPQASGVVVIDIRTGTRLWSAALQVNGARPGPPAITDQVVIVTDGLGNSYGFSRDAGVLQWSSPATGGVALSTSGGLTLARGDVAITSEGALGVSGMVATTGRKSWRFADVLYNATYLYAFHPDGQLLLTSGVGDLVGLEAGTNPVVRWRFDFPTIERPQAAAIQGDTLFVVSNLAVRALVRAQ